MREGGFFPAPPPPPPRCFAERRRGYRNAVTSPRVGASSPVRRRADPGLGLASRARLLPGAAKRRLTRPEAGSARPPPFGGTDDATDLLRNAGGPVLRASEVFRRRGRGALEFARQGCDAHSVGWVVWRILAGRPSRLAAVSPSARFGHAMSVGERHGAAGRTVPQPLPAHFPFPAPSRFSLHPAPAGATMPVSAPCVAEGQPPMIRFLCPSCKSILDQPDDRAGEKLPCPRCSQRLQVPAAPRPPLNKTVLGQQLPAGGSPPSAPSPAPASAPAPPPVAPAVVACASCDATLTLPAGKGGLYRCPACKKPVAVPEILTEPAAPVRQGSGPAALICGTLSCVVGAADVFCLLDLVWFLLPLIACVVLGVVAIVLGRRKGAETLGIAGIALGIFAVAARVVIVAYLVRLWLSPGQPPGTGGPVAGQEASAGQIASDEQAVKKLILDNEDDPKSVEFASWGPVMTGADLRQLAKDVAAKHAAEAGVPVQALDAKTEKEYAAISSIIEVHYRANNRLGAKELRRGVWLVATDGTIRPLGTWGAIPDMMAEAGRPWPQ